MNLSDLERPPWRQIYDRVAPALALLILVIALGAGVGTYFNDRAIAKGNAQRIADNAEAQVTACENSNESRAAARALWGFIFDVSLRDASPEEVARTKPIRDWINQVYQDHDCSDLSRKYPIPPPPTLPASS